MTSLTDKATRALRRMERRPLTHGTHAYIGGTYVPPMTFALMRAKGWITPMGTNVCGETVYARTRAGRDACGEGGTTCS